MNKIIALDMATQTGFAINTFPWKSGSVCFPVKRGESPGMRFIRFRAWLNETYDVLLCDLDIICYETPHHRGGAATAVCVGMVAILQTFAAEHNIDLMTIHTATLKKYATGNGRAGKEDMIQAARERFDREIIDDNEADALFILAWAISQVGDK